MVDGDLGAMLQGVLSDPGQMAKLAQVAQGLMGSAAEDTQPAASPPPDFSGGEAKLLSALGKTFSGKESSRSTTLLVAMRPYMRPEKQAKLDRALRMTQMVRVVQTVLGQLGGGHGV